MATNIIGRDNLAFLSSRLNLDLAKSVLFYYVLATWTLKAKRHLAARGLVTSFKEVYASIAKV